MLELTILRHAYPEKAGFTIRRPKGHRDYTFLHFHSSVNFFINGAWIKTQPHAVIIYRPGTPQFFSSDIPLIHDWMHFRGDGEVALKAVGLQPDTLYYPAEHSFITKLVGELEFGVNSLHHQAIKDLGEKVIPMAWATDGILESWYLDSEDQWLRAYQWHPEIQDENAHNEPIIKDFINACKANMK